MGLTFNGFEEGKAKWDRIDCGDGVEIMKEYNPEK